MLCRKLLRQAIVSQSIRYSSTQTAVIPFKRNSPKLIAKYLKFRCDGIKKARTSSPLNDLLAETKKKVITTLQRHSGTPQRFSKHLAELGLFSRNQAEELVKAGLFHVDGKRLTDPTVMLNQESSLSIYFPAKFHVPLPLNLKLWLYKKPKGVVTVRNTDDVFC